MPSDLAELSTEVREFTTKASSILDTLDTARKETAARLLIIEQSLTAPNKGGDYSNGVDIGRTVAESAEFKSFVADNRGKTGRITVPSFHTKTNIVSPGGLNQPLTPPYIMPGVVFAPQRRLTVRDLMPQIPVNSNMVEFCHETSFTSAAAMQTAEGNAKGESAAAYELLYSPVQTLAHWIPASRQIMDDSAALAAYINARLTYFLKLKEEDELLNGSGIGVHLNGLINNATAYDTSYTNVSTDSYIDVIGHAIQQVFDNSNLEADAVFMNPTDWHKVTQTKTTGTASSGQYIYSDPRNAQTPQLWGVRVVPTKSMAPGQFLAGNFQMAAAIWDRNSATVEVSREHSDFFTRNLVAILVEERLALTVFQPTALVYGGLPFGS
jgi:HK97 family phage major capsid protein